MWIRLDFISATEMSGTYSMESSETTSKMRVCFADGVTPGAASIEDPPVSKYDILRKNVSRGRSMKLQQMRGNNTDNSAPADDR